MTNPESAQKPRSDRSPWNWLLLIPIVVPLLTVLFNADSHAVRLPAVLLAAARLHPRSASARTTLVYQMTKRAER